MGDAQRYVSGNPLIYLDPLGLLKAPNDPSGLPKGWKRDYSHKPPNGERWVGPKGDTLDFHRPRPGAEKGAKGGKNHWHRVDKRNNKKVKEGKHYKPGEEIPLDSELNEMTGDPVMWGPLPFFPPVCPSSSPYPTPAPRPTGVPLRFAPMPGG